MAVAFDVGSRERNLDSEWREVEAGRMSIARVVQQCASAADLIVAAQTDAKARGRAQLEIGDRLVIESSRPVLIIPNARSLRKLRKPVLIAWICPREAARAAFDALPILQRAKDVRVLRESPKAVDRGFEISQTTESQVAARLPAPTRSFLRDPTPR
jgi:hypothetical protein